jgi:hypothetical protein
MSESLCHIVDRIEENLSWGQFLDRVRSPKEYESQICVKCESAIPYPVLKPVCFECRQKEDE